MSAKTDSWSVFIQVTAAHEVNYVNEDIVTRSNKDYTREQICSNMNHMNVPKVTIEYHNKPPAGIHCATDAVNTNSDTFPQSAPDVRMHHH